MNAELLYFFQTGAMSRLLPCHCKKTEKDGEEQVRTFLNDLESLFCGEGMAVRASPVFCY